MRAAVIEKPFQVVVKDVPMPVCGDDQVLIKVRKAAICNNSDWEVYAGTSPVIDYMGGYPHIMGHEQSGHIVEVGKNVTAYAVGDRVTCYWDPAGFAEYSVFNTKRRAVVKMDDRVSYEQGALLELAGGGAMRNVFGSGLRPSQLVVVMGVGPAGLFTGMVASLCGARAWIAIDLVDFRLQKAQELGAGAAFNIRQMSQQEIIRSIHEQFGEVDLVFETIGLDQAPNHGGLDMAIAIVKPHGNVRLFSMTQEQHRFMISNALNKGVSLLGTKISNEDSYHLLNLAQRWVAEGRYPIEKLITHHIPLEDVEKGLRLVHDHPEQAIKVIIDV
jgi:2-desacetyl-2-hydroxyethyl bacteriochlorophyllide A dehydrogenase